jgi:hypothetical protein
MNWLRFNYDDVKGNDINLNWQSQQDDKAEADDSVTGESETAQRTGSRAREKRVKKTVPAATIMLLIVNWATWACCQASA